MEGNLVKIFGEIEDPRIERSKLHKLIDIIVIGICTVICGGESWEEMEIFGNAKIEWLKSFLELSNGIPSSDTFRRVFTRIKTEEFQEKFLRWVQEATKLSRGEIVAIDGKTLRKSYDKRKEKAAIHMVSAWASKNRLVLGQKKVDEKSNEITAIPQLLEILEISGCIVTIDAMGCQKEIAKTIIEQKADYVLSLKGNQGNLHDDVKLFFETAQENKFKYIKYSFYQSTDGEHGRIEERKYWTTSDISWLDSDKLWAGLKSIGMCQASRTIGNDTSIEIRYFISSLPSDAKIFADAVRSHWQVENSLHWVLDVAFNEDNCRIRNGNAPENFAILRHFALNLLKRESSCKNGIKAKRLRAGWDHDYLLKVLNI